MTAMAQASHGIPADDAVTEQLHRKIDALTPQRRLGLLQLINSFESDMTDDSLDVLKRDIQAGIDSLDQGKGIPFNAASIKARGQERLAASRR